MDQGSTERIRDELRLRLARLAPGARVPSGRNLVAEFGASALTVQRAMHALALEGLVEARPGVGTFVRPSRATRSADVGWQTAAIRPPRSGLPRIPDALREAPTDAIALHSGYPDRELLPERLVRAALARAARADAALTRSPTAGRHDLRQWFAAELGGAASARDAVVLPGTQSGLGSILRTVVGEGHPLVVESPTYWGAIAAATQARVRLVPIPSGAAGPDPDALARALDESGARAFYAQPAFANPTGALWSDATASAVLDVVRSRDAFLIEDDWAHDFGIDAHATPLVARDDDGHVIHLRSLTKSVSPAIRVGAVVARGPVLERILADRGAESLYVSDVLQQAALDVVTQSGWATHRRQLRGRLRERRDALLAALAAHLPDARVEAVPRGGLHLWARLPDGADAEATVRAAESAGVLVASGDAWYPAEPAAPHLRLNYSGPDPRRFDEAIRLLARALT